MEAQQFGEVAPLPLSSKSMSSRRSWTHITKRFLQRVVSLPRLGLARGRPMGKTLQRGELMGNNNFEGVSQPFASRPLQEAESLGPWRKEAGGDRDANVGRLDAFASGARTLPSGAQTEKPLSLEEAVRQPDYDKARRAFFHGENYAGLSAQDVQGLINTICNFHRETHFPVFFRQLAAHDTALAASISGEKITEIAKALTKNGDSFSASELLLEAEKVKTPGAQENNTDSITLDAQAAGFISNQATKYGKYGNTQTLANFLALSANQPELQRALEGDPELAVKTAIQMMKDGFPEKSLDLFEHVLFPNARFQGHIGQGTLSTIANKLSDRKDIDNLHRFSRMVQSFKEDHEARDGMEAIDNAWHALIDQNPEVVVDGILEENMVAEFLTDKQVENLLGSYLKSLSRAKLGNLDLLLDNARIKNLLNEQHVCQIKGFEGNNRKVRDSSSSVISRLIFEEELAHLVGQKMIEEYLKRAIESHNSIAFGKLRRRIEQAGNPAWKNALDEMSKEAGSRFIDNAYVLPSCSFYLTEETIQNKIMRGFAMLGTHDCMRAHLNLAKIRQTIRAVSNSGYYTNKAEIVSSMADAFTQEPDIQRGIISYARELGIALEDPRPGDDLSQIIIGKQEENVLAGIFGRSTQDMNWMLGAVANQNPEPDSPAPASAPAALNGIGNKRNTKPSLSLDAA